jgi:hypothetical protein
MVFKHSPSISTLQRYAKTVGCRLALRLVKEKSPDHGAPRSRRVVGRVVTRVSQA